MSISIQILLNYRLVRECKGSTPILGLGCIEISTGAHTRDEKNLKAFTQISDYLVDI